MEGLGSLIGERVEELDTPCLMVDLDIMEENIRRMASICRDLQVRWRPHTKSCKVPALAHKLLEAGAEGICTAKLAEAEVMAAGGVRDILITGAVVGQPKVGRLISLARHFPEIKVVVDSVSNVTELLTAASSRGVVLNVLLEVNIGQDRCGVESGEAAREIAQLISESPGLRFRGAQGYEGHLQHIRDLREREEQCRTAMEALMVAVKQIEAANIPVDIVTTAGTGTFQIAARFPGITEVQPGSFIFMDTDYRDCGVPFGNALGVLATVISKPSRNRAVVDAGMKALSTDAGMAEAKTVSDLIHLSGGDEHGILKSPEGDIPLEVGQKIEFIPSHCDTTVNLYDWLYGIRGGLVETVWQVSGGRKTQ